MNFTCCSLGIIDVIISFRSTDIDCGHLNNYFVYQVDELLPFNIQ